MNGLTAFLADETAFYLWIQQFPRLPGGLGPNYARYRLDLLRLQWRWLAGLDSGPADK